MPRATAVQPRRQPPWRRRAAAAFAALALVLGALGVRAPALAWDESALAAGARRAGPGAVAALPALLQLLSTQRGASEAAQLDAVNLFFNLRIAFATDQTVWGQDDYWATPLQALGAGRGDCEDYAIAKYTVLLALGVPGPRLRLVYVMAQLPDATEPAPHMVLAYAAVPGAEPLILDNLRGDIVAASRRSDLRPVFSFNAEGLWQGVGEQAAGNPMARLSRWRETWQRVRAEGLP